MLSEEITGPAREVAALLFERGQTVAVAESSAGGLISAALLSVPKASRYYRGGVVFYNREGLHTALGGVIDEKMGPRGACEPFARFLALATRAKHGADWGIGETGAAGPEPYPYGEPAGFGWVSAAGPDGLVLPEQVLTGDADRERNMIAFASSALRTLLTAMA
ncbi:MAG TPA: CinA family protein [Pseudonocardia sp.]|jgi:PncC family amidohydrolase